MHKLTNSVELKEKNVREFHEGKYTKTSSPIPYSSFKMKIAFFLNPLKSFIYKSTPVSSLVLDVGCGGGSLAWLKNKGCTVIGCDFSLSSLKIASKVYDSVVLSDAGYLPFVDDAFGVVISADLLEHVPHPDKDKVILDMKRVLKKGGVTLHHIVCLSKGPLTRKAAKYPSLFSEHFISSIGHFGLESGKQIKKRFKRHFDHISVSGHYIDPFWDNGEYFRKFDNDYVKQAFEIRIFIVLLKTLEKTPIARVVSFLLSKAVMKILGKLWPPQYCHSLLIRGENHS